jgi:hypothetical protein
VAIRFWNNSECVIPIWPKIGITKQLDAKNKPVTAFLKFRKIDLTWRGQRSKFDLILTRNHVLPWRSDPASPMWTKIGTVKQLDPGNKPVMAFFSNFANVTSHGEVKGLANCFCMHLDVPAV